MGFVKYVKEEIAVIRERDPAIKSSMEVFLYPSFKAILRYRVAHKLYLKKHYFLARWVSWKGSSTANTLPLVRNTVPLSPTQRVMVSPMRHRAVSPSPTP